MINDLTRIFEPLTSRHADLARVDIIAFDIFGTLIDHNKRAKDDALQFAHYLAQRRSIGLAFISTEPAKASDALIANGQRLFALGSGVHLKDDFYKGCTQHGQCVLAIDDDAQAVTPALIHIDPNDDVVKKYLAQRAYRHPALFRR